MTYYKSEKLWNKDYIIIMIASAGIGVCNYFFFSTLPLYAQKLSGTAAYAGLMTGVYSIAALATRPISGSLSDKIGRTGLLILGALISTIASIFYNFASVLFLLVLIRTLHGVGFGMHSTSAGAAAADVIPKSRMAEGIGYFGILATIAAAVAPGVALSIVGSGEMEQFRLLFFLAAVFSFVSMLFDCCITYERKNKKKANQALPPETAPEVTQANLPKTFLGFETPVFVPAAVIVLLYFGMSTVTSFLTLFALDRDLGNIGLFFTINAAGLFLSRLFLGRIADRRGPDVIIIPGMLIAAVCLALIPLVHSLPLLLVIAFPFGLAQGAVGPTLNTLMFNRCSPQRRGTASAAYYSALDIGMGFGSMFFGVIADQFNFDIVFWGAVGFAVAALIVYLTAIAGKKSTPQPELAQKAV